MKYEDKILTVILAIIYAFIILINLITIGYEPQKILTNITNYIPMIYISLT